MAGYPHGIFVDPVAARRLTCQSVYRLQHLSARKFPWQEETFTEILLGHLTGVDYRIDADCPDCVTGSLRCRAWDHATAAKISGGLRLLTRPQEGGNRRWGLTGVGADFVYSLQDRDGTREIRLLIQAKRVRNNATIKAADLPATQRADLLAAASHYGAVAYYLFYAESPSAHDGHVTRCDVHTSPPDTSVIIVPAHVLSELFDYAQFTSVTAASVFERGHTLLCLDGCDVDDRSSAFDRLARFVSQDHDYQPVSARTELPEMPAVQVLTKASKPARVAVGQRITRGGGRKPVQSGEILWVQLGEWTSEFGREREGHGWFNGMSEGLLADSARMYWRLDLHRAQHLRYLVASAQGQIRAVYRIIDDSLTVHHDIEDRISFEVEPIDTATAVYQQVHNLTHEYLRRRKPRARNVVGYP
ncbi:hypothetical protein [Nocardia gipuzkoensis]